MTDAELDAIEQRAAAATPGRWFAGSAVSYLHGCGGVCFNVYRPWADGGGDITKPCAGLSEEDATFTAAARTDVPRLVAEVRSLRLQVAALAERVAQQSELLSRKAER
jgi:hypothetical protein